MSVNEMKNLGSLVQDRIAVEEADTVPRVGLNIRCQISHDCKLKAIVKSYSALSKNSKQFITNNFLNWNVVTS